MKRVENHGKALCERTQMLPLPTKRLLFCCLTGFFGAHKRKDNNMKTIKKCIKRFFDAYRKAMERYGEALLQGNCYTAA